MNPLVTYLKNSKIQKKLNNTIENQILKDFPSLATERLTLRKLSEKDVQEIFLLRSEPAINKYLGRKPCNSWEDALEFIENIKNNSFSYWAIVEKGNEKLVGTICLFDISEELNTCEIGYELLTEYQGNGIMIEAAYKIIDYALLSLGLNTIEAYTHKDNQSSINLLRKLKFNSIDSINKTDSNLLLFQRNINNKIN